MLAGEMIEKLQELDPEDTLLYKTFSLDKGLLSVMDAMLFFTINLTKPPSGLTTGSGLVEV